MDGILLLGQKSCIRDIKFKIYLASKSIPAAKSQNFVDISGEQKPTWAKCLAFGFFYLKRQGYIDIIRAKINLGSNHLHTKIFKLLIKLYLWAQKQGKSEILTFFGKLYLTFSLI